ncbi:MAG: hypothetical protein H0T89_01205 [Deltaproteobacteria bacterium]|nr:hypothetical protein [Deltaproteobacteria bacterium]MDQ3301181.1 hypothetical protein [Myxococcota bacterium]
MEHLDGEPLDARIDRADKLALAEALPILRGVARALDAAHGSIVHRDLKAENVFLASDPDRNISWVLGGAALAAGTVGVLLYVFDSPSPESVRIAPLATTTSAGVSLGGRFQGSHFGGWLASGLRL